MNQPSLFPEPRRNAGLFSQYYLDEILIPTFGKDKDVTGAADLAFNYFQSKFDALLPIIEKNKELAATRNEAQLEEDVIRPILKNVLGHIYDVQVTYKGDKPDYFLFATEDDKLASQKLKAGSNEYQKLNIGILDAKAWKHATKPERLDEANISQIFRYLINFNKRWGVLTNGFRWILFANKPGIRQDQYIEFDLSQIIENGPASPDFKLFIYLFRRQAFEIVSGTDATLDKVLDESFSNAAKLQSNLKTKVYDAFKIVAEEYRSFNKLKLETEQEIAELKETSLVFLYRILFLLYGESRLILPIRPESEAYYSYSLEKLLASRIEKERPNAFSTQYWTWLNELFGLIHGLEPDNSRSRLGENIGLPAYDGGLFDPDQYTKLEKWKLGDKAIKDVMEKLAYTGERRGSKPVRVSYRDLGVQHLGNIYEGILENKIIKKEDGTVDVITDNFERHATGSYYTPDYIVDYIVKETLQPIVDEALSSIKLVKKKKPEAEVEEAILRIKVLDPAMGSGHFLIGAIDFLAEHLAKKGDPDTKYTEAELQECRRRVGERCVYGVDLNPMAVELAKLSIWLHTLSQSKPLTFLDNHIKWGNSLIGLWPSDSNTAKPASKGKKVQEKLLGNIFPNDYFVQDVSKWLKSGRIFKNPTDEIEEVKAKESIEKSINAEKANYKTMADFRSSLYFSDVSDATSSIIARELAKVRDAAHPALAEYGKEIQEAEDCASKYHFFHWEIEFPQVYYNEAGYKYDEAGFDAVIGNPPYVRGETLGIVKEKYFKPEYQVYTSSSDIYVYFYELANKNLRKGGRLGFITSNKFIRTTYGKPLRKFLSEKMSLSRIVDFGELRVFEEAAAMPVIVEAVNEVTKAQQFVFAQIKSLKFDNLEYTVEEIGEQLDEAALTGENWSLSDGSTSSLTTKIRAKSVPLKDFLSVPIFIGIKTALNKAFIIDQKKRDEFVKNDPASAEILKPYLAGDDVRKYHINYRGRYLIWTYIGVPIEKYPTIFDHLKEFQPGLEARQDQGDHWWELRPCDYYDRLNSPKLIYPDISMSPRYSMDTEGYFLDMTAFFIPNPDSFILALLNSRLIFRMLTLFAPSLGDMKKGGRLRMKTVYVKQLPIRKISFTTPKKEREKLTNNLISESELVLSGNETEEQIKQKLQPTIGLAKQLSVDKNDVLHDFLSSLAEQMLTMNKEKQKLAEDFFMWMENYNIPPRSELKPKTFLDEFWKKEFKHILAHLKRNKVPPLGRQGEDSLLDRFKTSSAALLSLDKQIALTDWLIDQVVYALYGLSDVEIRVVERG
jgi:type I restriction-modification system DNA methylase subunit